MSATDDDTSNEGTATGSNPGDEPATNPTDDATPTVATSGNGAGEAEATENFYCPATSSVTKASLPSTGVVTVDPVGPLFWSVIASSTAVERARSAAETSVRPNGLNILGANKPRHASRELRPASKVRQSAIRCIPTSALTSPTTPLVTMMIRPDHTTSAWRGSASHPDAGIPRVILLDPAFHRRHLRGLSR